MKKCVKTITAVVLTALMLAISPMTDLSQSLTGAATTAKGAESDDDEQLYISDVRIGNAYYDKSDGPTDNQVVAQFEKDGYTVLKDGSHYADLNAGADAPYIKDGPNKKKVLLGYKTTTDPNDAITDLAVMNMQGGYSIEDYNTMMKTQMDSQIKPFVDRFIATLSEYRENLQKPMDSVNYVRADKMRTVLNCFTDDDTGGKPVGDLLVNETKYEMGDDSYNALSDEEKKDHMDILTFLMQANGRSVLFIEKMLTQASDSSDNTWYERLVETTVDDLVEEIQESKPNLKTRADVYKELDKKYEDTARLILKKWSEFRAKIMDYDDNAEEVFESIEENAEAVQLDLDNPKNITAEDIDEYAEKKAQDLYNIDMLQDVYVATCLESTEYDGGTMLDFFTQDYDKVSTGTGIRKLYPMVEALTAGQIAGLDFVSMEELLSMALTGKDAYEEYELGDLISVSAYEGVNREIYDQGGVALTTAEMRKNNATNDDVTNIYGLKDMPWSLRLLWGAPAISCGLLAFSVVKAIKAGKKVAEGAGTVAETVPEVVTTTSTWEKLPVDYIGTVPNDAAWNNAYKLEEIVEQLDTPAEAFNPTIEEQVAGLNQRINQLKGTKEAANTTGETAGETANQTDDITEGVTQGSSGWKWFSIGLSVAIIIMIAIATYFTISALKAFYHTTYSPIPKYIVDEVDITAINDKGERIMIQNQTAYYKVVTCNRIEGNSDVEKDNYKAMLDRNDLNGDIGKQWLALYAVKYKNGTPILADSLLYQKSGSGVPDGYSTGIHEFGGKAAADLNRKAYLYSSDPPSIRVYFKNAASSATTSLKASGDKDPGAAGSIVADSSSDGSGSGITAGGIALGGGIGVVFGGILGALIMYFSRRKKKEVPYE